jgi:hypothetical protein
MELGSISTRGGVKPAEAAAATAPATQARQDDGRSSTSREGLAQRPTPMLGGAMATQVAAPITERHNRLLTIQTELLKNKQTYQDISTRISAVKMEITFNESDQEAAALEGTLQALQAENKELKNRYKALLIEQKTIFTEVDTAHRIREFEKHSKARVTAWLETSRIASESSESQVMPFISPSIKNQLDSRDLSAEMQSRLDEAWPD